MNQLFYNLLTNSLKFSKKDTQPIISINSTLLKNEEVKEHADLNPAIAYCRITFRDNGIGFEQQFSEQIFNIFERLNSSDDFSGTGIGLALCKKIVLNHHGYIDATSNENEGAFFNVILPLNQ
jgi:two-component system CheB/CheR fusion protein